jgi:hypothetical protein
MTADVILHAEAAPVWHPDTFAGQQAPTHLSGGCPWPVYRPRSATPPRMHGPVHNRACCGQLHRPALVVTALMTADVLLRTEAAT